MRFNNYALPARQVSARGKSERDFKTAVEEKGHAGRQIEAGGNEADGAQTHPEELSSPQAVP
ncbi:hypothetical protein TRIP_E20054 [uncultured Spirochaetota bacterium]|nr:hypothetical protein TRIP_E20054 [uncultured Spirochaetota bacterium]